MTTLTAAPAMAAVIVGPENLSRIMASLCRAVWYCNGIPMKPAQIIAFLSMDSNSRVRLSARRLLSGHFLPTSLPAVPSVEQISEAIISDARNLMDHWQPKHPPEPDVARGSKPNCDCAVSAYVQSTIFVNGMQPATH